MRDVHYSLTDKVDWKFHSAGGGGGFNVLPTY